MLAQLIAKDALDGTLVVEFAKELHPMDEFLRLCGIEEISAEESEPTSVAGDACVGDRDAERPADKVDQVFGHHFEVVVASAELCDVAGAGFGILKDVLLSRASHADAFDDAEVINSFEK
ncbi:MAG: hypothetical protein AUH72_22025 [Acidobacteria bacterium 13_1_40CM_4_65_8]|nr:MAG: hypothetical protein AUH72_22025 [Acidobacteria bacterium 13_1_40CM_4_65_8]